MLTHSSRRTLSSVVISVSICLAAAPSGAQSATADGRITAEERQQLLDLLRDSELQFLELLAGVSDTQWSWKPAPDRWSVGECAEHIVRSNEALFTAAKAALAQDADPEWRETTKGKAELLLQVMPNRRPGGAGGASAPQEIRPTGEISRSQLVNRFRELYEEMASFVVESEQPWKAHTQPHPFPIFDPLSAYQWILYVPLHTTRHSKQMIEVMETEGFPGR